MDEEEIILTIINEEEVKRLVLLLMLREFSSGTLSSFTQVPGCWCPKSNQTGRPHRRLLAVKACSSSCLLLPWLRHDHSPLQDFSGGEIYRTGGPQSNCEAVMAKLVICQPLPAIIPKHRHLAKYKTTSRSTATKAFIYCNIVCYLMLSFPLRVKLGGSQEGVHVNDH